VALQAVEPTAVLLIRAWVEADGGLRARITRTLDASSHEQIVTAAASPEEVVRAIVEWLDAFLRSAGEVTDP